MRNDPIRKAVCAASLVLLCAVILAGCAKKAEQIETSGVSQSSGRETGAAEASAAELVVNDDIEETKPAASTEKREVVDGKIRSILTGEWIDADKGQLRPLAIMMSNDKQALPQYGINRAGVVYEAPVEGVMVRYMALFDDWQDLERIGSVRSCRTYYTYFAREWDAIYAHYGQSTFALPYLEGMDNLNGISGKGSAAYYRSSDKKSPHNAYASGKLITKAITDCGYRTELEDKTSWHFNFCGPDDEVQLENSIEASKIVPGYPYNEPWFEYDEKDGLYHRYQYGGVHEGDEGPITVKNVIFEYHPTGNYATTQYLNIDLSGETYGYFFTNGRGYPLRIVKDGEYGITHFYNMEGDEVTFNNGKTWICILRADRFSYTEIYGNDGVRTN
jgi:hypothetical protein